MIVVEPFPNERINVSKEERDEINRIVDQSAAKWSGPGFIVQLLKAARKTSKTKVYLRSEGWHQLESYNGSNYKHVSLHYAGWTYHLYSKVNSNADIIASATHMIDSISYMHDGHSYFVDPD